MRGGRRHRRSERGLRAHPAGARVVVLDHGEVGGGETGRTSAHLSNALDDRYHRLAQMHGADRARLAASSHTTAIEPIEGNAREASDIDCDFRRVDGYLFATPGRPEAELDRELEAARAAGLDVERVTSAPLPFDTGPALRFARQAQIYPVAYVAVWPRRSPPARAASTPACMPWPSSRPTAACGSSSRARGAPSRATSSTRPTRRSPARPGSPSRQAAYRTYVIAVEVPTGHVPLGLYWDTDAPYHYARIARHAAAARAPASSAVRITAPARIAIPLVTGRSSRAGRAPASSGPARSSIGGPVRSWSPPTAWRSSARAPTSTASSSSPATPATASPTGRSPASSCPR